LRLYTGESLNVNAPYIKSCDKISEEILYAEVTNLIDLKSYDLLIKKPRSIAGLSNLMV